jgi:hypothetical protein
MSLINQVPQECVENVSSERELYLIENQYWVSMYEALERLKKNDDFKKVILDGYFKDKAVNGVSLLAIDQIKKSGARSDVMEELIAISALQDYFITIQNLGSIPPENDEDEE